MAKVKGGAYVTDHAIICGKALVSDYANINMAAVVNGDAWVCGTAIISSIKDYIVFKNSLSSGRWFTWTKSNDKWRVGCFYGSGQELIKKAYADDKNKGDYYKTYVELVENLKKLESNIDNDNGNKEQVRQQEV